MGLIDVEKAKQQTAKYTRSFETYFRLVFAL